MNKLHNTVLFRCIAGELSPMPHGGRSFNLHNSAVESWGVSRFAASPSRADNGAGSARQHWRISRINLDLGENGWNGKVLTHGGPLLYCAGLLRRPSGN